MLCAVDGGVLERVAAELAAGGRRGGLGRAGGAGVPGAAQEVIGVKTVLTWAVVVFVIYYVFTAPEGAAHVVDAAVGWLRGAGSSLGTFLNHVKL